MVEYNAAEGTLSSLLIYLTFLLILIYDFFYFFIFYLDGANPVAKFLPSDVEGPQRGVPKQEEEEKENTQNANNISSRNNKEEGKKKKAINAIEIDPSACEDYCPIQQRTIDFCANFKDGDMVPPPSLFLI